MDKNKPILVTGGTGFIGSYILRRLVADGYTHITALRRADSRLDMVAPVVEKIKWIEGDLLDSYFLFEVLKGVHAVIHAGAMVSFSRKDEEQLMKVNVEGTANLVNACLENDVSRFIHISSIAVFSRGPGKEKFNEESSWDEDAKNTIYAISKYKAEIEVWRASSEGLPVAIVNPSLVVGSGFWDAGSASLFKTVYEGLRFYPTGINGFVDVRDVADASVSLLSSQVCNERLILNGENLSYKEVTQMMANAMGKRVPNVPMNWALRELALLQAKVLRFFGGKPQVITRGTLRNASQDCYYDAGKSVAKLNIKYRPISGTISETGKQLVEAAQDGFVPKYLPL